MGIYLDYNASSPIDLRVLECMNDIYKNSYGNADSRTHDYGDSARKVVENARAQVANLIGRNKDEIFFTSGSTESNNIAVLGLKKYAEESGKKHIITSSIEHKAILESVKALSREGFRVDYVKPDSEGMIRAEDVLSLVTNDTLLVSIMHVNNETGVIQPIKEIGDYLADKDVLFHTDATQSAGKLVDELKDLSYDMMSFCAHKMSGPQGIGVLVLKKKRYKLPPVQAITYGGSQEHGIRPGTLPVALIAGFGKACEIALLEHDDNTKHCLEIKDVMLSLIEQSGLKYSVNGSLERSVCNTLNISIEGVSSEALMLSSKNFCGISNGSACNSSTYSPSFVLMEMGLQQELVEGAIRISWGANTDLDEAKENFNQLLGIAKDLIW
ncbi:cysteine desulfurase [Hathewaya proteolytica DSM 3090]|uniref:cysteine desulfurase n=1 Tax=Hathewaya proteolytica DSM 3090 TaxID=1121331 RepID=A0A1M6LSS5_9CLOT|nr:cysteine desulfurase family protein [Hathewaya proteolytica]SHJ74240.1 cysteine desulfurase [Hathewaya proteolytica DSM 3090]